jgi:hypothetical protein
LIVPGLWHRDLDNAPVVGAESSEREHLVYGARRRAERPPGRLSRHDGMVAVLATP